MSNDLIKQLLAGQAEFAGSVMGATSTGATNTFGEKDMAALMETMHDVRQERKKVLDEVPEHLREDVAVHLGWAQPKVQCGIIPPNVNAMYGSQRLSALAAFRPIVFTNNPVIKVDVC